MVLGLAVAASTAAAQRAELEAGLRARAAGDHEAALAAFSSAWDTTAAPIARAEMAIEELALGRYVLAETHASEALVFSADPAIAARVDELSATRDTAAAHLGSIEVRCPEGFAIRVDGEPVGTSPLTHLARVEVGRHTVEATRAAYEPARVELEVSSGALARATLAPVWIDDRPLLARSGGEGQRIAGWTLVGAGAIALVVASIALGVELDRDAYLRTDACTPTSPLESRESRCPDAASLRASYTDVTRALFVSAAVLGLAGILLVVTAPSDPSATSARCAPSLAPGFVCQVTF
jgi:hypothetical protein